MEAGRLKKEIVRKRITHKNITYLFQWNQTNHRILVSNPSLRDYALSLWGFLERVYNDNIPHHYFSRSDFARASNMRLASAPKSSEVSLAYKLAKEQLIKLESYSDFLNLVKKVVSSSTSHASVLSFLLNFDPLMVASEVPVYNEELKVTGHVDLLRLKPDKTIQVLDFKPGLRDANLILAIPQVATYGLLLSRLVPLTENHVECVLFNDRESISFKPDLMKKLGWDNSQPIIEDGKNVYERKKPQQLYQSTLDSIL